MGKVNVCGINHVALWVSDLKSSTTWYTDILGLDESKVDEHHAFLKAGDQVIALFQAAEGQTIGGPHHVALQLPDGEKEQAVQSLKEKGVKVESDRNFCDPDGHSFHFA